MKQLTKFIFGMALLTMVAIPQARAEQRERTNVNQALANSMEERSSVAKYFQKAESSARKRDRDAQPPIQLEIGDELGGAQSASRDDTFNRASDGRGMRENGVSGKLDREWKEVNQDFKKVEAPSADGRTGRKSPARTTEGARAPSKYNDPKRL